MSVRFAPSPTGTFHIGNLRTAWVSWKWAQALECDWVVRFEDIDKPRVVPGAQEKQLLDLRALGLHPDKVYNQSSRHERHWQLFQRGVSEGALYPCVCTRKELRDALDGMASAPHLVQGDSGLIYNGHCRANKPNSARGLPTVAWRFRNADEGGAQDFIVGRTTGLVPDEDSFVPSYHWACAIDDLDGEYKLIVRAWDLRSSVEFQRAIQSWILGEQANASKFAAVFHTSLVVQPSGHRLEKRTRGVTLAELLEGGKSTHEILKFFEESFTLVRSAYSPGVLFGEPAHQLSLLGFINAKH